MNAADERWVKLKDSAKTGCCFLPFTEKERFAQSGSCAQASPACPSPHLPLGWRFTWTHRSWSLTTLLLVRLCFGLRCSRPASLRPESGSMGSSLAEGGCGIAPGRWLPRAPFLRATMLLHWPAGPQPGTLMMVPRCFRNKFAVPSFGLCLSSASSVHRGISPPAARS